MTISRRPPAMVVTKRGVLLQKEENDNVVGKGKDMSMQTIGGWLGEPKKVALLLLAAGLAAVAALGLASAAHAATFSDNEGITIKDSFEECSVSDPVSIATNPAQADPYPSENSVSGLSSVTDVNVTVTGLSHVWPDDLGLLLVSPAGQSVILMADSGGFSTASGIALTFDDAASSALPDEGTEGSTLASRTYLPSIGTKEVGTLNCLAPASFPGTAPAGPYGSSLSVFNDTNPNGTWQLYVIDDTKGWAGFITGWSLDISTSADTTPPKVTDTSPLQPKNSDNLTATFSEPAWNVSPQTFMLERNIAVKKATPKYLLVDATVTPNADGLSAVLDPVQVLPKGEYRATITTDVTDLANNKLDQDQDPNNGNQPKVWFFTVNK